MFSFRFVLFNCLLVLFYLLVVCFLFVLFFGIYSSRLVLFNHYNARGTCVFSAFRVYDGKRLNFIDGILSYKLLLFSILSDTSFYWNRPRGQKCSAKENSVTLAVQRRNYSVN